MISKMQIIDWHFCYISFHFWWMFMKFKKKPIEQHLPKKFSKYLFKNKKLGLQCSGSPIKLWTNRSKEEWVKIEHTNKQTDKQILLLYTYIFIRTLKTRMTLKVEMKRNRVIMLKKLMMLQYLRILTISSGIGPRILLHIDPKHWNILKVVLKGVSG